MKKILILTNHSYMLYRFRRELIEKLMETHEVVLSMPFVGHEDDFKAMGLHCIETDVDRRGVNPKTDAQLLHTYVSLLRREQPDLVITYSIKPNIYGGLACERLGIPFYANVQGLGTAFERRGIAELVTTMYRMAFRRVRTVFFENEANAQEFLRRGILSERKCTVLCGAGINLREYPCEPYPQRGTVRFLYLGRIMREKGMDELLCAFRWLHAEFGERVALDLVGFYEEEYQAEVEQLTRAGTAVFYGFQQDPRPFYAAAGCVVLPSWHEGMSNVLLEAAATGRPVITSDIPGCREAVEDGVSGLLCTARDAQSLYAAMRRFVQLPAQQRAAMGAAGRALAEARFDKDKVVASTIAAMGL